MSSSTSTNLTHAAAAPCQREYVTYSVFVGSILMLALKLVTLATMGRLLVWARFFPRQLRSSNLSLAMCLYLGYHTLNAITSTPHQLYKIFWWQPPEQIPPGTGMYNVYILFWTGILDMAYNSAGSLPVFFLTIDRICALNHGGLMGRYKKEIAIVGVFAVPALYLYCLVFWIAGEWPLSPSVMLCQMAPSLMSHFRSLPQLFGKLTFGTANFIACIVFLVMLKRFVAAINIQSNLKNRTVKFAMFCELLLDMVPTYFGFFFNMTMGVSAAYLVGEYVSICMCIEAAVCGVYYWAVFRQSNKNEQPTNAQPLNDRPIFALRQGGAIGAPTFSHSTASSDMGGLRNQIHRRSFMYPTM